MAYEIRIKGDRNPIIIESNTIGEKIRQDFFDFKLKKKPDNVFTVSDFSGTLSCIGSIKMISRLKSENNASDAFYAEANKKRLETISLSPEERSKRLGFFHLVYWGFTKKRSEEVFLESGKCIEEFVYPIQRKFFEENPNRTICDPELYRPLIKSRKCDEAALRIIERAIQADYQDSIRGAKSPYAKSKKSEADISVEASGW